MAFEVNQWKAENPAGTPQQIADAIHASGGLTPELAQSVATAYGTNVDEINAGYNNLTASYGAPAPSYTSGVASNNAVNFADYAPDYMASAPVPQASYTTGIATNAPINFSAALPASRGIAQDPAVKAPQINNQEYVNQLVREAATQAGGTLSYADVLGAANRMGIAPEMVNAAVGATGLITSAPASVLVNPSIQQAVSQWKADNPNGTPQQLSNAIAASGGLTPEIAQAVANVYGTNVDEINAGYGKWNPYAQMATMYGNQDYAGINSLLGQSGLSASQFQQHYGLTNEQMNQARGLGINLNYTTPEIQSLADATFADKNLAPWEQVNKILETGQKYGFGESDLEKLYGKEAMSSYLDTYKGGIADYINKALATDPTKTTFDEVGQIHQAAQKYGLTADEMVKYGGLDPATAKSYFDMYERGLGSIVTGLNDPKVDDLTKTKTQLALQQKYGTTDEDLAKASNGKYTTADIKAYLDPVRNVPVNLQKLFDDPDATAADIQKFVTEAKLDPRAAGIYGAALDKVLTNTPALYLRDAATGKADISDSYEGFLAAAKSTPELATQYAPQIKAIENAKTIIAKHALNKDFGGEYKDYAMQMFLGLDKDTVEQAPKQLEFTERKTDIVTGYGEAGETYEYEREISPAEPKKGQGAEPIYEGYYDDGGGAPVLTGYRAKVDSTAFGDGRNAVYATYDPNGNLTGYESGARVHVSDPAYYQAKWDANGQPKPTTGVNSGGGFLKNMASDVMGFANDLGPIGQIGMMYALGGLGSLASGALANTAVGAALGTIGTNAVGSGLVSGVLSDVTGGSFEKGFLGGAVGSGVGNLTQGMMPTNMTGNPLVDTYLAKALPGAASSMARTGVMGGDVGDAGLYSLLNTGVNMGVDYGTNKLLGETGMDKLGAAQPYVTGAASNLVSSALTGQDPNLEKALMKTLQQQILQSGKSALKTAKAP